MGGILFLLGALVMFVGAIMVIIGAFKDNILWGLLSLFFFIPVGLIWAAMNWGKAKKGVLVWLAGFVLCVLGGILGGSQLSQLPPPAWLMLG